MYAQNGSIYKCLRYAKWGLHSGDTQLVKLKRKGMTSTVFRAVITSGRRKGRC
jgi:hypothetical protein